MTNQLNNNHQHSSFRDSHHSLSSSIPLLPFFVGPRQRQRWGEEQRHPHKDWGDIFYDLFFVAAAYNLGNVLREDPTPQGLLYFVGCFVPLNVIWQTKVMYDARYYFRQEDLWHFLYESAVLLALASTVLHIQPVALLAYPAENREMLWFGLSLTVSLLLNVGRCVEIIFCQKFLAENQQSTNEEENEQQNNGSDDDDDNNHEVEDNDQEHVENMHSGVGLDPVAIKCSQNDILALALPILLTAAATIYSGYEFYCPKEDVSSYKEQEETSSSHGYDRTLAGAVEEPAGEENNIPMYLLVASGFAMPLYFITAKTYFRRKKIDITTQMVPINVGYSIHRYGEWTMLMLGETVLSLLIVEFSHDTAYYKTFYGGFLSIILLEYLHFRSQPHDPDQHALRRSVNASVAFTILMMIYSSALVVFGASYKMFLYEYMYENRQEQDGSHEGSAYGDENNKLEGYGDDGKGDHHRTLLDMFLSRYLAGGESAALRFSSEDRQQRIAYFFCGSLAVVWFCLDAMSLAHRGLEKNLDDYKKSHFRCILPFLLGARVVLIVWFATLGIYVTDPHFLSLFGVVGIVFQFMLRIAVFYVTPRNEEEKEMEAIEKTLAYASARIQQPSSSSYGKKDTSTHSS